MRNELNVFLIEDDEQIKDFLEIFLSDNNYNLIGVAYDKATYSKISNQYKNEVDLILMDVTLKDCNGIDCLADSYKKSIFKNVPIIFMSTFDDDKISKILSVNKDASLISKPFHVQALLTHMEMALAKHKSLKS